MFEKNYNLRRTYRALEKGNYLQENPRRLYFVTVKNPNGPNFQNIHSNSPTTIHTRLLPALSHQHLFVPLINQASSKRPSIPPPLLRVPKLWISKVIPEGLSKLSARRTRFRPISPTSPWPKLSKIFQWYACDLPSSFSSVFFFFLQDSCGELRWKEWMRFKIS